MADFENVVVDITAEELEERVKKPIDMEARAGSLNFIYSGAVHSAVENVKVRTDNIVDGSVTSNKLGQYSVKTDALVPNSVTEEKLSSDSVTTDKIAESAVTPNELDRVYTESISTPEITSYAQLDEYLTPSDGVGVYNTLYKISFASSFPAYGLLGSADYIGFVGERLTEAEPTLILINTENFSRYLYIKGSASVTEDDYSFVPKNLDEISITNVLGGDWGNMFFYVYNKRSNEPQKSSFKQMMSSVGGAEISTSYYGIRVLSSILDEIGTTLDGVEDLLSSI